MNRLRQAYVHVTHKCNMDCIGCNVKKMKYETSYLRMEDILNIVIKLKSLGLKDLILTGGEPFTREDIKDICKHIKTKIGIENLTIMTNGNFDYSVYEEVIPYIDKLVIATAGTQGINNIEKFKKSVDCSLEVKIHKKNKEYINNYIKLSKQLGIHTSFNILSLSKDDELYEDYVLSDFDLMDISHSLLETQRIIHPIKNRINLINIFCDSKCMVGCHSVSIDVKGDIYPCRYLRDGKVKLGNILQDDFTDIINFNQIVLKQFDVDNINECRNCEYKNMCQGGCRARSYHHNGTIYGPDVYCEFLKKYFNIKRVQLKPSI